MQDPVSGLPEFFRASTHVQRQSSFAAFLVQKCNETKDSAALWGKVCTKETTLILKSFLKDISFHHNSKHKNETDTFNVNLSADNEQTNWGL